MGILISIIIGGLIGYKLGTYFASPVEPPKVDIENTMSTNKEEKYTLTKKDENKIILYALKQLKYNQNELQISTFMTDCGSKFTDHNWAYYAFLDDLSITIYVNGIARWKSDSELSLLTDCANKFIEGENPFEKIKIELRSDEDDEVIIEDWKIIEKFIDILYDTYFKLSFHMFVSLRRQEIKKMNDFRKERKERIYKKIGIGE